MSDLTPEDVQRLLDHSSKLDPILGELKRQHKGHDWHGQIVCPICGGVLHVAIVGHKQHSRGRCQTVDCLSWME